MAPLLTFKRLHEILKYIPATGDFFWKERSNLPPRCKNYIVHNRPAGRIGINGYRYIGIDGKLYLASRLVIFYTTGKWPNGNIDHVDRKTASNKIKNLRLATKSQNAANMKRTKNNRSGYKGVGWCKKNKQYRAYITHNYKYIHLGYFINPKKAHAAYKKAAKQIFGKFARFK